MKRSTLHLTTSLARVACAALALTLYALPAEAQLGGRLKKIGGDIVKDAAGKPPETKPSTANDIAITPERLDAVIVALGPAVERARIQSSARGLEKEFKDWQTTYTSCLEGAMKASGGMPSGAGLETAGKIAEKQAPMLERMSKYAQARNQRALAYIQDSIRVLSTESQAAMFAVTKCGKVRYSPAALIEADLQHNTVSESVGEDQGTSPRLNVPAAQRAGMTHYQFGMIRERMALWALVKDGLIPADRAGKSGVFSDGERAALNARSADISKFTPLFKDSSMAWLSWGDIQSW